MNTARTTIAIIVATTGLFASATSVVAASDVHIDDVALRLERRAKEMVRELRYNYRHAPHYGHLISDARDIARSARHIHDVAHDGGRLRHLRADLRELDEKVHHLRDVLRDVQQDVRNGHGHIDGDPRRARRMYRRLQETAHHLQADIRTAIRWQDHHHGHRHSRIRHNQVVVPIGRSAGMTWNGRNFSIRVGSRF